MVNISGFAPLYLPRLLIMGVGIYHHPTHMPSQSFFLPSPPLPQDKMPSEAANLHLMEKTRDRNQPVKRRILEPIDEESAERSEKKVPAAQAEGTRNWIPQPFTGITTNDMANGEDEIKAEKVTNCSENDIIQSCWSRWYILAMAKRRAVPCLVPNVCGEFETGNALQLQATFESWNCQHFETHWLFPGQFR